MLQSCLLASSAQGAELRNALLARPLPSAHAEGGLCAAGEGPGEQGSGPAQRGSAPRCLLCPSPHQSCQHRDHVDFIPALPLTGRWPLVSRASVSSSAAWRLTPGVPLRSLPAHGSTYFRAGSLSSCTWEARGSTLPKAETSPCGEPRSAPEVPVSVCLVVKARCSHLGVLENLEPLGFGIKY